MVTEHGLQIPVPLKRILFLQNYFHFREAMLHPSVVPYTLQQMSLKWQMLYLPQVIWKSHCHVVQWSDVTGCHLLRGRMSGGRLQSFCCFSLNSAMKHQLPFEGPSFPSSLNVSVEKLKYKAVHAWRLNPTQSQTIHQTMKDLRAWKGMGLEWRVWGGLCKVLLFLVRFTVISPLQL